MNFTELILSTVYLLWLYRIIIDRDYMYITQSVDLNGSSSSWFTGLLNNIISHDALFRNFEGTPSQ